MTIHAIHTKIIESYIACRATYMRFHSNITFRIIRIHREYAYGLPTYVMYETSERYIHNIMMVPHNCALKIVI